MIRAVYVLIVCDSLGAKQHVPNNSPATETYMRARTRASPTHPTHPPKHTHTHTHIPACVEAGGDRQELHEAIRELSMEASRQVKEFGKPNDLLVRIAGDARFKAVHAGLDKLVDPSLFIGRCPEQVVSFISQEVRPVLDQKENKALLQVESKDGVQV